VGAGIVGGSAVIACALLVFLEDGRTPWVAADSDYAAWVARCQEQTNSGDRHRCVRQIAAIAATPGASAPIQVTRR
jgi:hypothetical protein